MPGKKRAPEEFQAIAAVLRSILQPYEKFMVLSVTDPTAYSLDTRHNLPNGKPLFFAGVKVQNNYVSFYLMPVYVFPDLLIGVSDELRNRMQGKSCFNFKKSDPVLFADLENLTRQGFERYKMEGYLV